MAERHKEFLSREHFDSAAEQLHWNLLAAVGEVRETDRSGCRVGEKLNETQCEAICTAIMPVIEWAEKKGIVTQILKDKAKMKRRAAKQRKKAKQ